MSLKQEGARPPWRKIYASVITSEKLSECSFEARWLWLLLCLNQDNEGKNWATAVKLKSLIVSTDWSVDYVLSTLMPELAQNQLATIDGNFINVVQGAKKNGTPPNARKSYILTDDTPDAHRMRVARVEHVTSQKEKQKRNRNQETEILVDQRFAPLVPLKGYRKITPKSVQIILKTAEIENVLVEDLIKSFVAYWEIGRIRHNWKDPVASMIKTLPIVVSKLKGELNGNYRQTTYPRNPRKGSERVWKSGSEWDRVRREIGRSLE